MFKNNLFIKIPSPLSGKPSTSSRNIPEPIKREIRKKCGFGCVVCGSIIYDYDHMIKDWSEVKEHVANDITLLCPTHHREKTNGLLTRDKVKEANENPFNIKNNASSPYKLHFSGEVGQVVIASNIFTNDGCIAAYQDQNLSYVIPILIDGAPIVGIRFQDERLLLNIKFFNQFNEPIFVVVDNQLMFKPDTWDIDLRGSKLMIREGPGKVLLELDFIPPNKIIIAKAKVRFDGVTLELKKDHLVLNGKKSVIIENNIFSSLVGISIGNTGPFPQGLIHNQQVDRYPP